MQCSRTHRSQELPDILHVFNGGFSCKSFSKLNGNYETFKKAMQDEDEDAWCLRSVCGVALLSFIVHLLILFISISIVNFQYSFDLTLLKGLMLLCDFPFMHRAFKFCDSAFLYSRKRGSWRGYRCIKPWLHLADASRLQLPCPCVQGDFPGFRDPTEEGSVVVLRLSQHIAAQRELWDHWEVSFSISLEMPHCGFLVFAVKVRCWFGLLWAIPYCRFSWTESSILYHRIIGIQLGALY